MEGQAQAHTKLLGWDTACKFHTVWKVLSPVWKGSKVPTGTIINLLRTARVARNGNDRLYVKSKPPLKWHGGWQQGKTLKVKHRCTPSYLVRTQPASFHTVWKGLFPSWKGLIVPTGTIINLLWTVKVVRNSNDRLCLKWKPPIKCHWIWPAR